MLYPIAIIKQQGTYHGRLPDIPRLEISADNMADIIASARFEVIAYLQSLAEDEHDLPECSDVSTHLTSGEYAGWNWAIVNISASRIIGEDVAITLNIPERLIQKLKRHLDGGSSDIESFIISTLRKAMSQESPE